MPDLANAMRRNPTLKVMLNAGYFDLATPFYQGVYEMHHLPIPQNLSSNIESKFYQSGHMVYAREPRSRNCTTTSQISSAARKGRAGQRPVDPASQSLSESTDLPRSA